MCIVKYCNNYYSVAGTGGNDGVFMNEIIYDDEMLNIKAIDAAIEFTITDILYNNYC